jgi:hypothetical protein
MMKWEELAACVGMGILEKHSPLFDVFCVLQPAARWADQVGDGSADAHLVAHAALAAGRLLG